MIKKKQQTFNDGIVKICETDNEADPGDMPVEALKLKGTYRFKERTVGNVKYNMALQNGVVISRVIRCPKSQGTSPHDMAVVHDFETGETQCYEIKQIQYPEDIYPPVMDLSLSATDWSGKDV